MYVHKTADCVMQDGMEFTDAWMGPWLDKTLISVSNRMRDGYTMVASGSHAYLISPMHEVYKYIIDDGLYHPMSSGEQHVYKVKPREVSARYVVMGTIITTAICLVEYIISNTTMSQRYRQ